MVPLERLNGLHRIRTACTVNAPGAQIIAQMLEFPLHCLYLRPLRNPPLEATGGGLRVAGDRSRRRGVRIVRYGTILHSARGKVLIVSHVQVNSALDAADPPTGAVLPAAQLPFDGWPRRAGFPPKAGDGVLAIAGNPPLHRQLLRVQAGRSEVHVTVDAKAEARCLNDFPGLLDVAGNEKFNSLMDTFDVLKQYNYAAESPVAAERELSEQKLAEGEIAFMFGGNWDWSMIAEYDYTDGLGMMAVPQNMDDGTNEKLVGGGSKFFMIDSSDNTSDTQRQEAKDFLNWLVYNEDGQKFVTEDCALIPAYSNIEAANLDPLGASVKKYADAGQMIDNYNYFPDDHYSVLGGNGMQKYLAGEIDRAGLAQTIVDYWKNVTPVEHG